MFDARCALANGLWAAAGAPARLALARSTGRVAQTQAGVLRRILAGNSRCEFGVGHAFAGIRDADEYRDRVPVSAYDDYREAIDRIAHGEAGVLTEAPVTRLVPTGGATSGRKLIPYTAFMRAAMDTAVRAWVADLFGHMPGLLGTAAYWSVSPAGKPPRTDPQPFRVPTGFDDDAEYLGAVARRAIPRVLAVPSLVRHIEDVDTWRYVTAAFLARTASLGLVSVWNPTYLRLLLDALERHWESIAADVRRGLLRPPRPLPPSLSARLQGLWRADPRRADQMRRIATEEADAATRHARLWPALRLVSCWADAHARGPASDLAALLPQARLQRKGLMATEGFITLPILGCAGAPLAVQSHFFEFIPRPRGGGVAGGNERRPRLAHELTTGDEYSVVLSNGAGLYRYRLRDVVRVVDYWGECPLLEFVGKEDQVSDRVGEKLDGRQVQALLQQAAAEAGIAPVFAMVAWEEEDCDPGRYVLFTEAPQAGDDELARMAARLDVALRENPQYAYARDLGQLGPVGAFRVEEAAADYLSACVARGQRLGDIKPVALHAGTGWARAFHGRFLKPE
jgi:hypothetical protein